MKYLPLLLLPFTGQSLAESFHAGLSDRWQFDISILSQEPTAKVRSTQSPDRETEIDLKRLGVDDRETAGQIGARYRINDKWWTVLAYSPLNVSGTNTTDRSFNFAGKTFPLSSSVSTDLELKTYIFAMDYAFQSSDTTEWGVGAGVHAIDLSIEFEGNLNDLTVVSSEDDLLAPLPNLRIYMKHALSEKWLVGGSLGWLGADIDNYRGDLMIASVFVNYRVSENWTFGARYQGIDINLKIDNSPDQEAYDIRLPGIALNLTYSIPN